MKTSVIFLFLSTFIFSQQSIFLTDDLVSKLVDMPLKCINQEYPNKTAHVINNHDEAILTPKELHPSFYGCFDWHSSVHGHWLLVKLLKERPSLNNKAKIIEILDQSFTEEALLQEAEYFTRYDLAKGYERTYGWAWLLKLDEELMTWDNPKAKIWSKNLKPLTEEIIKLWKDYLPKQTYPNRTGVHSNSAFAMSFALDWAKVANDVDFQNALIDKAKSFYLNDRKTPAYLEPDGSDFFSPSLEIADLMRRILPQKELVVWIKKFYEKRSIINVSKMPIVSDLKDYQTVHLVGLSFSKAWCMKGVSKALPIQHPLKNTFETTANHFIEKALPLMFESNYGGDHWLASFAVFALLNHD